MIKEVYCSEIPTYYEDDLGFFIDGKRFEFKVIVRYDMITLMDCLARSVPIDLTQIDQVIDALITARSMMLVPLAPDTYVQSDMGC